MCDGKVGGVKGSETGHEHNEVMVPGLEQIEMMPGEEEAPSHTLIGKKKKKVLSISSLHDSKP